MHESYDHASSNTSPVSPGLLINLTQFMQVAALEVREKFVVLVNFMPFNSDKASFVFKIHTSVFFSHWRCDSQ